MFFFNDIFRGHCIEHNNELNVIRCFTTKFNSMLILLGICKDLYSRSFYINPWDLGGRVIIVGDF